VARTPSYIITEKKGGKAKKETKGTCPSIGKDSGKKKGEGKQRRKKRKEKSEQRRFLHSKRRRIRKSLSRSSFLQTEEKGGE